MSVENIDINDVENIVNGINKHRAVNNKFFDCWINSRLCLKQIQLFARNYWEWTFRFPEALASLIANTDDIDVRAEYSKTLYSELGYGDSKKVHSELFKNFAYELLTEMSKKDSQQVSNFMDAPLLPATIALNKWQKELYTVSYTKAVGAQLALEWQAYAMISRLYEGARNYMDLWNEGEKFHEACEFFYAHIASAEKEHKVESINSVIICLENGAKLEQIKQGYDEQLELIANFWDSIAENFNEHR